MRKAQLPFRLYGVLPRPIRGRWQEILAARLWPAGCIAAGAAGRCWHGSPFGVLAGCDVLKLPSCRHASNGAECAWQGLQHLHPGYMTWV